MIRYALFILVALLMVAPAHANDLRVVVVGERGRPIADAVVTLHTARPPPSPLRFAWPMRIAQRDMQFDPFVLIAPAGASVSFPNLDDVRHQVYSFSQAGPFELRLYGHDESRSVQFRNVGVIAIGCNIHDQMQAYIYVVDTPYANKTAADGVATLDAPAGQATLRVWHPDLRAPNNTLEQTVTVGAGQTSLTVQAQLRGAAVRRSTY